MLDVLQFGIRATSFPWEKRFFLSNCLRPGDSFHFHIILVLNIPYPLPTNFSTEDTSLL